MKHLPIGVFDSGIGGLTVAREIARCLPLENIVYLGDTARLPYGTKSPDTVRRYAMANVRFLSRRYIKALVVACNSASSVAIEDLRHAVDIPVLGVIAPGARLAAQLTRSGRIGVIGTEATVSSRAYDDNIKRRVPDAVIFSQPCTLLVALAEEGWIDHPVTQLTLQTYLKPIVAHDIDVLVLGCTHYPVLKEPIREVLTELGHADVQLVDSAEAVAAELEALLRAEEMLQLETGERRLSFFVTDNPKRFVDVGRRFFGDGVELVEQVDV